MCVFVCVTTINKIGQLILKRSRRNMLEDLEEEWKNRRRVEMTSLYYNLKIKKEATEKDLGPPTPTQS